MNIQKIYIQNKIKTLYKNLNAIIYLPTYVLSTYGRDGLKLLWKYGNTLVKLEKAKLIVMVHFH